MTAPDRIRLNDAANPRGVGVLALPLPRGTRRTNEVSNDAAKRAMRKRCSLSHSSKQVDMVFHIDVAKRALVGLFLFSTVESIFERGILFS